MDLGRWLDTLGAGRCGCVFAHDVADTLSVLEEAATSEPETLRVVSLTWKEVPPLANELGLLVSALGRAVPEFFPALYGLAQDSTPNRWSKAQIETEAHAITRAVPRVDGGACRRILSACHEGRTPSLGKLQRAAQVRQFALAIEPKRLVVLLAVLAAPASNQALHSLAQGVEWLAGNAQSRVVVVLPNELAKRPELDHVTYGACLFADPLAPDAPAEILGPTSAAPAVNRAAVAVGSEAKVGPPQEPTISVSPIVGRPARRSDAECALFAVLTEDVQLRSLFAFNQPVRTVFGSQPIVDVLWAAGRLVIEIDGRDHRGQQKFEKDRERDLELLLSGYSVVRFTDSRVILQTEWVVERIREAVRQLRKRDAS